MPKAVASAVICAVLILALASQPLIPFMHMLSNGGRIQAYAQDSPDYLAYENSAHGIKMEYPADWERYDGVEQGEIVQIISPFENDDDLYRENFGIFFEGSPTGMDLEEYAGAVTDSYSSSFDDFELLNSSSLTLAGTPAYQFVFTARLDLDTGSIDIQSKQIIILKDARAYLFFYYSESGSYLEYLPLVDDILASVSLNPSSGPAVEQQDFVTFQSARGIKIQYPADWEKLEDPSMPGLVVRFVSPETNRLDYREEFVIYSERIPGVFTLDDYVRVSTEVLEESLATELNVLDSSNTNLGGNQAHRLVYSAAVNGTDNEIQAMILFTIKSGIAYTLSFVTSPDLYTGFTPTIEKMIESFTFVSTQTDNTGPEEYLAYDNSTYSIRTVKYPDNWIILEPLESNATEVTFYSPGYDASVSVGYFDFALPSVSLDEYTDFRVSELRKRVSLFNLISSNETTLAGEPASMIVYKGHLQLLGDKLFPYKLMEVYTISDGRAYTIAYGTFEELYPTYLPLAQNMLDSFEPDRTNAPKALVGIYDNSEIGLHIDLPENWTGLQKHESGITSVLVSAEDASLDSDYSSIQILLGSNADLNAYFQEGADYSVTCTSDRTFEVVNVAGAKALKFETVCDADEYAKYYTYYMQSTDKDVYIFYQAPNDSVYRANLEKFHESASSIRLASAVDLSDIDEYARYSGLESESFRVEVAGEEFEVKVATNSSITNFELVELEKKLSITLDGKDDTSGETYLEIGAILEGDYDVLIDGEVVNETDDRVKIIDDQTTNQTFISIMYTHSEHFITIIGTNVVPEFPAPVNLIASLVVLAVVVFVLIKSSKGRLWQAGVNPS